MRNRLNTIIILICFILLVFAMFKGVKIGNLEILSISQLKEKNSDLDDKITKASTLTSIDYPKDIENLKNSFEEYIIEKDRYEELSSVAIENMKDQYETKQYDISYLWRVIGNYATKRNLTLGIEVKKTNSANSLYNFNFTVSGQYTNIIQFIMDLENDSDLYFRIYNFKMSGSEKITAKFTVKNINIDPSTIKDTSTSTLDEEK